ncbi:hypothetical protein PPACK8108_LOCUS16144 [Phakopsora pachyrhizi]|uniref:Uncharacterized protein n=1 Tax=Phakopsora pachyrhizi TaxID=170000 RepID=A0AAV0B9Y7_PHAPC|nr:hypothetical protein PPACK8108_LOCUS16144 [Phakopsora pachyrhizi]
MRSIEQSFTASNLLENVDPMSSKAFEIVYEELLTVVCRNSSVYSQPSPDALGLLILFSSEHPNVDIKLTKNATESKTRFEQQALYFLSNVFLLGPRAIFTANTINHRKQSRWQSLARLEVTRVIIEEELKKGQMGLHWGPFDNIRWAFLNIAYILIQEEQWFIGPNIMALQFAVDIELIVNTNLCNEKEICK